MGEEAKSVSAKGDSQELGRFSNLSLQDSWPRESRFSSRLDQIVSQSTNAQGLLNGLLGALRDLCPGSVVSYLQLADGKAIRFVVGQELLEHLPPEAARNLGPWIQESAQSKTLAKHSISGAHQWSLTVCPIVDPELLGAVVVAERQPTLQQLSASSLSLVAKAIESWCASHRLAIVDEEASQLAALAEISSALSHHQRVSEAGLDAANRMQTLLAAERVVIGLCQDAELDCRVVAVSGLSRIDQRAELTRLIESAMNECLLRNEITEVSCDTRPIEGTRAHGALMKATKAGSIQSVLLTHHEHPIGVCVVVGDAATEDSDMRLLRASQSILGSSLAAVKRQDKNLVQRMIEIARGKLRHRMTVVCCALVAVFAGVMLVPMPYRIGCECQLEPVSRRFVAAPYDGALEKTHVKPGDLVRAGQTLATMDARELRWELSGLNADYRSEGKARDAALARDEIALAQQSDLEMQRMRVKMDLIEHRLSNLDVKSPMNGVVITGDLEKSEGVPLQIGQVIFEIGPLEEMMVEVAIPERDILHADVGMRVDVLLDASMRETFRGVISQISPRSDLRDGESVYIAEVAMPNTDGHLRPGMKGKAKVVSEKRLLGWILFHRAWESFAMTIGI